MILFDENRASDSPVAERVWRCHSEGADPFLSIAASRCELVVSRLEGKITVTVRGPETRATPHGYIAGPNGEMDWIGEIYDEAMGLYENELLSSADTLLLERVTYQSFAGSWPHVPDNPSAPESEKEYARKLNAMHKIVFSRTLESVEWNNSTLRKEVVPEEIEQLKQEPGRDMLIYGSASIIQTLTNHGLIDEYQVLVHPVILGGGKPLFQNIQHQVKLKLVNTKTHPSEVVVLSYQPREK